MKQSHSEFTYSRKINPEEVLELWENSSNKELGVYIDNPFCKSLCRFCCYQGILYDKEKYKKYYEEYLPRMIDFYREILEKKKIVSWFFGGGTPSLVKSSDLDRLLNYLPGFRGEKTFEVHPAFWDKKQLDILKKHGFDNIIIGVQSFDRDILRRANRVPASMAKIYELVQETKKRKMNVCIDLIAFINKDKNEHEAFRADIKKAMTLNPEEVTLQLNFDENINFDFHRKFLMEAYQGSFYHSPKYRCFCVNEPLDSERMLRQKEEVEKGNWRTYKIIRIFKKELAEKFQKGEFFTFVDFLEPIGPRGKTEVLGIGSCGELSSVPMDVKRNNTRKNVFSRIFHKSNKLLIVEENVRWSPEFYLYGLHVKMINTLKEIARKKSCGH